MINVFNRQLKVAFETLNFLSINFRITTSDKNEKLFQLWLNQIQDCKAFNKISEFRYLELGVRFLTFCSIAQLFAGFLLSFDRKPFFC